MLNPSSLYRESIAPISSDRSRPLWSVMIPTYNCAHYLRETLHSVLMQDPGVETMQIEVVDDCSTQDNPEEVVQEVGQGRIRFYRQPQNVGHVKNFNTCLQRSRGHLIHLLHGDDCVRAGFYQKVQQAFQHHANIGSAFCRHIYIDPQGHWISFSDLEHSQSGVLVNWLERIAVRQRIQTPSVVVRREVYEQLGGFDQRIQYWGEDWEMWVRIAAAYPVWYEPEPLALYRVHPHSLSGNSIRTGANIKNFRQAIYITKNYLPPAQSECLSKRSLENYARYALNDAQKLIMKGDSSAAINQIREALKCHVSFRLFLSTIKLILKIFHQQILGLSDAVNSTLYK